MKGLLLGIYLMLLCIVILLASNLFELRTGDQIVFLFLIFISSVSVGLGLIKRDIRSNYGSNYCSKIKE